MEGVQEEVEEACKVFILQYSGCFFVGGCFSMMERIRKNYTCENLLRV